MAACPSLNELLEGVPPGKLGRPCTDTHLCEIALHVTNWKSMAPFLGLSEAEIEEIRRDESKTEAQQSAMLQKWKEKCGRKATYRRLATVFYKQQQADLVDMICKLFLDDRSSSSGQSASRLQGSSRESVIPPVTPPRPSSSTSSYVYHVYGSMHQQQGDIRQEQHGSGTMLGGGLQQNQCTTTHPQQNLPAIRRPRVMKMKARLEAQARSRVRRRSLCRELERLKVPVVRRRRHKRGCKASGRSGDEMEADRNVLENQVERVSLLRSHELKFIVDKSRSKINTSFSKLCISIEERLPHSAKFTIQRCKRLVIAQYPSTCDETERRNFVDSVLYGCETAADIFDRMGEHKLLDPLRYPIVEALVNTFLPDDGKLVKQLRQYKVDLGGYTLECNIEEYLRRHDLRQLPEPDHFCELTGKTRTTESSLQFVVCLWDELSDILHLPLSLYNIVKGCVCITWIFPAFLIPHVVREIGKCHPFFKENEFLWVKLNSCQVYPTIDPEPQEGLRQASEEGRLKDAHIFLELGANVKDDYTALIAASRGGHLPVVQLLIDRGADISAKGEETSFAYLQPQSQFLSKLNTTEQAVRELRSEGGNIVEENASLYMSLADARKQLTETKRDLQENEELLAQAQKSNNLKDIGKLTDLVKKIVAKISQLDEKVSHLQECSERTQVVSCALKQALEEKARLKKELEKTEDQFKWRKQKDFLILQLIYSDQKESFRGRMAQQEEAFHVQIEDLGQRLAHQEKLCATLKEQDGLRHRWSDHAVEVKVEEERSHERQRKREKELYISNITLSIDRHREHIKSRLFYKLVALLLVALACAVVLLVSSYTRVR